MDLFCDECGREILCEDELGRIDKRRSNIAGKRHTTETIFCADCINDEVELMRAIVNSPEIEIEINHDKIAKQEIM